METAEGIPVPAALRSTEERLPEDALPPREKLEKAEHKTGKPPSRLSLQLQAAWWRSLQRIGMTLHFLAPPWPPNPDFTRSIPSTLSKKKGKFNISLYVPAQYRDSKKDPSKTYPAIVNFHGGGFTLGEGTDDARFARFVVEICNAVFVSVDYRLSPEHPFPNPVEDGADALLYVIRNAAELRIDPHKLATSGFSAGGNIAITAPLRLAHERKSRPSAVPDHRILALAAWYPITDYTLTRAERRATSVRPDETLPPALTTLFDASYLYPPDLDLADPCLSPSKASDDILIQGVASHVLFYTCEWDMLLREGEDLARRFAKAPIEKDVYYKMIPGVAHGWDKGPNPVSPPAQSEELYRDCCERLKAIFDGA